MKTFVLSICLVLLGLLAVGAPAPAPAAAADEFVVAIPLEATNAAAYIRTADDGGELLTCELMHEAKKMAVRITDNTGAVLDFMKVPTGATERYANPYQGRNPPKPGYTTFKGQTCTAGCYAKALTASVGQGLKCEVRP